MKAGGIRVTNRTGFALAALALCSSTAIAQDAGGLNANFTFAQGLTFSDSEEALARSNLGFSLTSETRTQSLEFNARGTIELGPDTFSLNPSIGLAYGIENRQTALTMNLSYRIAEVDSLANSEDDEDDPLNVLAFDDALRGDTNASVRYAFGQENRFGGDINFGFRKTLYSETSSSEFIDSERTNAGLNLRFEIDPLITAGFGYNWAETDFSNDRNVVNENLMVNAMFAVSPTVQVDTALGLRRVETTTGGVTTLVEGLTYNLSVSKETTSGGLKFALSSDVSEVGRRTTAIFGGTYATKRGQLRSDVGISQGIDDEIRPLISLSYREDLARGNYSIAVSQRFNVDPEGVENLDSQVRLNWLQNLTSTSSVSSALTYRVSDALGVEDDSERFDLAVSYSQALTEDWDLRTSFTHSRVDQDGQSRTRENVIFIGLETSVGWRP